MKREPKGTLLRAKRDRDLNIDEIAVERACNGDRVTLTVAERGAAIAKLTRRGLPARVIAERLGMSPRTVQRHRSGLIKHSPLYDPSMKFVRVLRPHGTLAARRRHRYHGEDLCDQCRSAQVYAGRQRLAA